MNLLRFRILPFFGILVVGVSMLLTTHAQAEVCEKTVRWNDDMPYSSRSADGLITGFYVDVVQTALQRMGCSAVMVEMPWGRALVELEAGRLDMLPGALKTEPREAFAWFSRPLNKSPNVLFVAKSARDKFNLKKLADIIDSDFQLGTQVNVSYGPQFEELSRNPTFNRHLSPIYARKNGWKMLQLGRIDGLIADEVTGLIELRQLNLNEDIVKSAVVVSEDVAMIALSKKTIDTQFVSRLNKNLDNMINDGTYARIREKHIPCKTSAQTLACK